MTEDRERPLAGLAKIDRDPRRPFARLVAAAETNADAGRGLALAYEQLADGERRELIEAIVGDADREGVSPASALLGLLSVEAEPEVANRIAEALRRCTKLGVAPEGAARALLSGDEASGALVLAQPLHGLFIEVIGFEWNNAVLERAIVEPFLHRDDLPRAIARVTKRELADVEVMRAVDTITPVLWRHRRSGRDFPAGLERFAELFRI